MANGHADMESGMERSTPYRLFRAMQEIGGLTKRQIDNILDHHQSLLLRMGDEYRSRSNALPLEEMQEVPTPVGNVEQTQPV